MGAADPLKHVCAAGFTLDLADGKLLVAPASMLTDELRAALRAASRRCWRCWQPSTGPTRKPSKNGPASWNSTVDCLAPMPRWPRASALIASSSDGAAPAWNPSPLGC